jgi:hypothetical protein
VRLVDVACASPIQLQVTFLIASNCDRNVGSEAFCTPELKTAM